MIRGANFILFRLVNGGVHSGEKAFILLPRRMVYPGRVTDLENEFGISYSTIIIGMLAYNLTVYMYSWWHTSTFRLFRYSASNQGFGAVDVFFREKIT